MGLPPPKPIPVASPDQGEVVMISRLELLTRVGESIGDMGEFQVGKRTYILVNSPSLIKEVLVTHASAFEKSDFQRNVMGEGDLLRRGLGNGLLTSSNTIHHGQQKVIGRAFDRSHLEKYADVIAACSEEVQSQWVEGEIIDIPAEMMYLATYIIGQSFFQSGKFSHVKDVARAMADINGAVGARITERKTKRIEAIQCIEWVHQYVDNLIANQDVYSSGSYMDLLDILMKEQAEQIRATDKSASEGDYVLTDQQLRDEIYTVLFAGAENPKNALSWTWYLLAKNKDVYSRVRSEVCDTLQGRSPTYSDLADLPYTLQVFKEVLRMYPPGYAFGRRALRSVKIGGMNIPKGANLLISPYTLHRRRDYYPNPEHFNPDRFSPAPGVGGDFQGLVETGHAGVASAQPRRRHPDLPVRTGSAQLRHHRRRRLRVVRPLAGGPDHQGLGGRDVAGVGQGICADSQHRSTDLLAAPAPTRAPPATRYARRCNCLRQRR